MPRPKKPASPFRYFNSSPEVIRLVVMMYVRYPLSLRNVEDLLFERGIDICHETVRHWWNRFGPLFAADIRRQRVSRMRGLRRWQWQYAKLTRQFAEPCLRTQPPATKSGTRFQFPRGWRNPLGHARAWPVRRLERRSP